MAGPFSAFLPLTNKPLMARLAGKQNDGPKPKSPTEHHRAFGIELETNDKDDEWYDTSTSEDPSPVKKKSAADTAGSVVTIKNITPEEEEKLLLYMPALFGTDLPPCGLEVQVAYEIVNARLRQRWLNARGRLSALDICQAVNGELRDQNYLWPPFSIRGKSKRRRPWCREIVFKHQLSWIEYFVREAQAQDPELMTESELWERKKEPEVPPELGLSVQRSDVLKMWESWNAKKRVSAPVVPDVEMEDIVEEEVRNDEEGKEASGDAKVIQCGNDSSEETIVQKPEVDGSDDDARAWSQGNHD